MRRYETLQYPEDPHGVRRRNFEEIDRLIRYAHQRNCLIWVAAAGWGAAFGWAFRLYWVGC